LTAALAALATVAACGPAGGGTALAVAAATLLAALALQARAFGGRTGDTLGATGKMVEIATLVALSARWGS
ncbi:MAG TPA: adenosylcobinamide-GDP ribazoletransferase, partial [Baekduia sp.]|nr:adenosylcobinamide-GDP ribazoletransferase [Baekduia sp.]